MKIVYILEHPVSHTRAEFTVHNADPGGFAKVVQEGGLGRATQVAAALAHEKMPTWLYVYNIVDWRIVDEDAPPQQVAA